MKTAELKIQILKTTKQTIEKGHAHNIKPKTLCPALREAIIVYRLGKDPALEHEILTQHLYPNAENIQGITKNDIFRAPQEYFWWAISEKNERIKCLEKAIAQLQSQLNSLR